MKLLDGYFWSLLGDIAAPDTFPFDIVYRVVPGLTFAMCRSGKLTPVVTQRYVVFVHVSFR